MTSPSSFYKESVEEFDKRFPPFRGIGAQFPIFEDTPNRNNITLFIKELSLGLLDTIASWTQNKDRPFPGPTDEDSAGAHAYSAALDALLAFIKEEKKRIEDAK